MSSVDHDNARAVFEDNQIVLQTRLHNYYPFKAIHPYDSWIKRMRISWLGETSFERSTRHAIRSDIWARTMPDLNLTTPILPPSSLSSSLSNTPTIGTVGLGLSLTNIDTGFMTVASKLSSLANTPTNLPMPLPEMANAFNNPVEDAIERLKAHVSPVTSPVLEPIITITSPVVEASSSIIDNLPKTFAEVLKTPVSTPVTVPVESTPLTLPVEIPPVTKVASVVTKTVTDLDLDENALFKSLGI